jgi:hypothetical protein
MFDAKLLPIFRRSQTGRAVNHRPLGLILIGGHLSSMTHISLTSLQVAVAISVLGLAVSSPASAQTAPVLKLADNVGNMLMIDGAGVVTATGAVTTISFSVAPGSIGWMGTIGNFTVSNVQGLSKPIIPFPDLGLSVFNNGATTGTLTATGICWNHYQPWHRQRDVSILCG